MKITWVGSPNYRRQFGVKKKFVVMHWMVGTLESTDKVFQQKKRPVSTQYGIGDNEIHQYVRDKDYAFGSGDTYANKYGISIEHEGGYLKNGKRVKPSAATHETSAHLLAHLSREHGWGRLKVGVNVFPHSHFKPTQCPGTLDIHMIAARANELLDAAPSGVKPSVTKYPKTIARGDKGMTVRRAQKLLDVRADGVFGAKTEAAVRAFQKSHGLTVDGIVGPRTWKHLLG